MKYYRIEYIEGGSYGELSSTVFRGYDADHAVERFMDSMGEEGGSEGIEIVSVTLD